MLPLASTLYTGVYHWRDSVYLWGASVLGTIHVALAYPLSDINQ